MSSVRPAEIVAVWSVLFDSWTVSIADGVEVLSAAIMGRLTSVVGVTSSLMTV